MFDYGVSKGSVRPHAPFLFFIIIYEEDVAVEPYQVIHLCSQELSI